MPDYSDFLSGTKNSFDSDIRLAVNPNLLTVDARMLIKAHVQSPENLSRWQGHSLARIA